MRFSRTVACWVRRGLLVGLLGVLAGCGREEATVDRKLAIIGLDSADWLPIDTLLEQGRMPRLAAFLGEATAGTNMSFVPLEKSPMIWASMATGLRPEEHGIGGFVRGDGGLADAHDWRAPGLWDLGGEAGLRSCVVNWWVTYPARPIPGVLVSDAYTFTTAGWRGEAGLVRPADLEPRLAPYRWTWEDVPVEELGHLIDLGALAGHEAEVDDLLRELRVIVAGDLAALDMARELAGDEDWDLFAVYFRGLDLASHRYWRFWETDKSPTEVTPLEQAVFGELIPNYYAWCDVLLGEVLDLLPPERAAVVVSDHGFHGPRHRKRGWVKGTEEHRPQGVFAVRAPIYERGVRFDRMEVMDVAPTLLALMGLPASDEMGGRVLTEGLTKPGLRYVERLESHRVASYQAFAPAQPDSLTEEDSALDEAVRRQLKSLGYIN